MLDGMRAGYFSVLLLSYSIITGALGSPGLLPSCSIIIITIPFHITIILTILHLSTSLHLPCLQIQVLAQLLSGIISTRGGTDWAEFHSAVRGAAAGKSKFKFLFLYASGVLLKCCIRQLSYPSIISFNDTSIAHYQYTDIHPFLNT